VLDSKKNMKVEFILHIYIYRWMAHHPGEKCRQDSNLICKLINTTTIILTYIFETSSLLK
jgi:hypothetical protein